MKHLYYIRNDNNEKVVFSVIDVYEETENEYIVNVDMGDLIKNVGTKFPKDKINEFLTKGNGFVTDNIYNKKLLFYLEKIYKSLDDNHNDAIKYHSMCKRINEEWYKGSLEEIKSIRKNKID